MDKRYSTVLRASIPLAVYILGGIYLSRDNQKVEQYNPRETRTANYMLIDADRDGDVDAIIPNGGRPLVDPEMKVYIQANDRFFDMYGFSVDLPKELQESATRTMNGIQDTSLLEKQIKDALKQ